MRYFLELCIKSVQAAIVDLDAEIIVVDNHSSDNSCQMVAQFFPEVILIQNNENFGFSKGNNIGVAKAKGEYLCILNPDTVVAEDTFFKILAYAKERPKMGVLGCQLIDGRGQFLPESKRNIPTPMVSMKKILGFPNAYYANHLSPIAIGKVNILVGAFMFLKKEIYTEVNGFDEDYFMYGEDIDLSYKVRNAGYQNVYYGKTAILHYKGESTLKDKDYATRFYGAMHIFYKKHFKSSSVFDVMVWIGIRLSRLFLKIPKKRATKTTAQILMTQHIDVNTELTLKMKKVHNMAEVPPRSQVVFNGNSISYKTIIESMRGSKKDQKLTFRIQPKDAQFIIGSDSSKERGEVVLL